LSSWAPKFDRPQLIINLLEDGRPESMTDPEIINGKPHAYRPISVRTA
jgi:hypothetical protein